MTRLLALLAIALFTGSIHAQALDGRLKKIAETKSIAIGVRGDAMPFSFMMGSSPPDGFTVDLCKRVAQSIARQLKIEDLKVQWVLVTVQSRFDVVAKGTPTWSAVRARSRCRACARWISRASPSSRAPGYW